MQRTYYFTDQDVLAEDLNNTESTKASAIKQRTQYMLTTSGGVFKSDPTVSASVVRGGVYGNPLNYMEDGLNLKISKNSSTQLLMESGEALGADGEFIQALTSKTMNFGGSDVNYAWASPGALPPDGALYYVKIKYAAASGSVKANDAGVTYPTRYTDSYNVTINNAVPVSGEILLASFAGDTSGHIKASIKDERLYIRPIVPASGVILDPTVKPYSAVATAEDHILAVGTGIPSPTNPHGLTGNDIGLTDTTAPHRKEAHIPAIVDTTGEYPNTTPFRNSYLGVPYDEGANAGIAWTAPHASASIMVNGVAYHPTLDIVDFTTHPDVVAGGYPNYYYFYYEGTGSVVRATTSTINPTELGYKKYDKFALCYVYVTDGGSAYSNFTDLRRFYSTSQIHIRAEASPEYAALTSIIPTSTLWDNLSRIRYQLGLALNGSDWLGDNPLTQGVTSIADSYHQHTGMENATFTLNRAQVYTDTYIAFEHASPNPTYIAHFGWRNNLSAFAAIDHFIGTIPTYGKMIVGSLQMGNTSYILTSTHVAAMPTLTGGSSSDADAYHTHGDLKGPLSGSLRPYTADSWRRNDGDTAMFVTAQVAVSNNFGCYAYINLGPVTGSTSTNLVARTAMATGSAGIGTLYCMVPPNWVYRIAWAPSLVGSGGSASVQFIYEYPPNGNTYAVYPLAPEGGSSSGGLPTIS